MGNGDVKRLDVDRVLAGLKDFQRDTVEYVFQRLYLDEDKVSRFLIADEVGLGKTLIARGIIAKAIDYLWEDELKHLREVAASESDVYIGDHVFSHLIKVRAWLDSILRD